MGSSLRNIRNKPSKIPNKSVDNTTPLEQNNESKEKEINNMSNDNEFDFISDTNTQELKQESSLPDNLAITSLNVGIVGVGGGGGKLAKAFMDQQFNKVLLINSTDKDKPNGIQDRNLVLLPQLDGLGKNVENGKKVFSANSPLIEDALRIKFGKVDFLIVCCTGGGGSGSSTGALREAFNRYLKTIGAAGRVIYLVSTPSNHENLNDTIKNNSNTLLKDLSQDTVIIIDNEKQLAMLRGKVGIAGIYPMANSNFVKLVCQILKLTTEKSDLQVCDSEDLKKFFETDKRVFLGSSINTADENLGSNIIQKSVETSACPSPKGKSEKGLLLLVLNDTMAADPVIGKHLESAISYVGARCSTLFSGVYIRPEVKNVIAILGFSGLEN